MQSTHFQLVLQKPCTEDWAKMPKQAQGRFCDSCQKTVVDFTTMSEAEIIAFFQNYQGGSICGRLRESQLNTSYERPSKPNLVRRMRKMWQVAAAGLGLMVSLAQPMHAHQQPVATIQTQTEAEKELEPTNDNKGDFIALVIGNNGPAAGIKVRVYYKSKLIHTLTTDAQGKVQVGLSEKVWQKGFTVKIAEQGEYLPFEGNFNQNARNVKQDIILYSLEPQWHGGIGMLNEHR